MTLLDLCWLSSTTLSGDIRRFAYELKDTKKANAVIKNREKSVGIGIFVLIINRDLVSDGVIGIDIRIAS